MLGWHISVHKQPKGGRAPATFKGAEGICLVEWQTGLGGLDWIDDLVRAGKAIDLGGNGYPYRYTARAEHLRPGLLAGPPCANEMWVCGPDDILTSKWKGQTTKDLEELAKCRPDEWLLIEVWDES